MSPKEFFQETPDTFSTNPMVAEAHYYCRLLPAVLELPADAGRDAKLERLEAAGGVLSKLFIRANDACVEGLGYTLDHAKAHSTAAALNSLLDELAEATDTYDAPDTYDPGPDLARLNGAHGRLRMLLNHLEEDIRRAESGGGAS